MPSFEEFCEQLNRDNRLTNGTGHTIKLGAPWMLLVFFGLLAAKLGWGVAFPWWFVTMPLWIGFALVAAFLVLLLGLGIIFFVIAVIVAIFAALFKR